MSVLEENKEKVELITKIRNRLKYCMITSLDPFIFGLPVFDLSRVYDHMQNLCEKVEAEGKFAWKDIY